MDEQQERHSARERALMALFDEGIMDYDWYNFKYDGNKVYVLRLSGRLLLVIDGGNQVVRYRHDTIFAETIKQLATAKGYRVLPMDPTKFGSRIINRYRSYPNCNYIGQNVTAFIPDWLPETTIGISPREGVAFWSEAGSFVPNPAYLPDIDSIIQMERERESENMRSDHE